MFVRATALAVLLAVASAAVGVQLGYVPPPSALLARLETQLAQAAPQPDRNTNSAQRASRRSRWRRRASRRPRATSRRSAR